MSHVTEPRRRRSFPRDGNVAVPPLEPGDHLDQSAFHAFYREMPDATKAELIGGVEARL